MSFWSSLLKIGANVAPALLTGGASLPGTLAATTGASMASKLIPSLIGAGLNTAGSLAAGQTAGRTANNANAQNADQLMLAARGQNINAATAGANTEMEQAKAKQDALNTAYKQAIQSSLALNMKDVSVNRPAGVPDIHFSGGARPSALGQQGHDAATAMNSAAMQSLLHPQAFTPVAAPSAFTPTPMQGSGVVENVLGGLGAAGHALDSAQARNQATSSNNLVQQLLAQMKAQNPVLGAPAPIKPPPDDTQFHDDGSGSW